MSALSEFYLACRNGDVVTVRSLLPNMSYEQKNRLESNGSTALHAATYYGHHDIVKLLLENGCATWIRNGYKNFPYNEAQGEQMLELFRRPVENNESNRFASTTDDCFSIVTCADASNNDKMDDDDEDMPKGWVDGYKHIGTSQEREATVQQIVHAQMMKYCLKKFQVSDTCKDVHKLLKKAVPVGKGKHSEVTRFFDKFRAEQDVGELIRVFTVETPFYEALLNNVDSFAIELYSRLSSLQDRVFPGGTTYRGLTATEDNIKAYRWAAKDKGRIIEIKKLQSSSREPQVAIDFALRNYVVGGNKHCVLCEFKFPNACYTAIDLNMDKPITVHPEEQEILLLPGTLFEVREVTNGPKDGWYTIKLENVPVPKKILMQALKELKDA